MGLEDHWPRQLDLSVISRAAEEIADRTILLGDDVAKLLGGDIGAYLISRAREQLAAALFQLADEKDPAKIAELQFQAHVAKAIPEWLQDAIDSGRQELEIKLSKEGE